MNRIGNIRDVVNWNLCVGCGTCVSACDKNAVVLQNMIDTGIRPVFDIMKCIDCTGDCLSSCPGAYMEDEEGYSCLGENAGLGNVLEAWEGYASDSEIRHNSSSGGILTALALYCLEKKNMESVIHTGMDTEKPWLNKTVESRTRKDILSHTGSRYSPSSPCEKLSDIINGQGEKLFIGKPCDVQGVHLLKKSRPELAKNLGLVLSIFCAGTPSTAGTLNLISSLEVPKENIDEIHYRGMGWPGGFRLKGKNLKNECFIPYEKAWGKLNHFRPFRCSICPDSFGRFADISCGDAWHSYGDGSNGRSIVLVRTPRGSRILNGAAQAGYVNIKYITLNKVTTAQKNLMDKHSQVFGRLLGMGIMLAPYPVFNGFGLYRSWKRQSLSQKQLSIAGTIKRILTRGLWRKKIHSFLKEG